MGTQASIDHGYPEVRVGDLVIMLCHGGKGLVIEVTDCGAWADDIKVLCNLRGRSSHWVEEWEQDEVEVISAKA